MLDSWASEAGAVSDDPLATDGEDKAIVCLFILFCTWHVKSKML